MFIDEVRIYARAGRGGNGCVAFLREAYKPRGGPAGGDGGRGGNVILVADENVQDLTAQLYEPRLIAQNGEHGKGKGMHGRKGKDLIVRVPCGTVVWRIKKQPESSTNSEGPSAPEYLPPGAVRVHSAEGEKALMIDLSQLPEEEETDAVAERREWHQVEEGEDLELVADLVRHGQRVVLCRGGRGGRGNRHFATPENQAPRYAEPGEPGEEGMFLLELRLIADVGLVGYPNAGKSTLLAAMTRARPKVAPYPFTTLHPHVGVLEYEDWFRLTLCDVPGLIEGAHRNVGLGHAFLRHIRRCRALLVLVDMAGTDGREPWDDFVQLRRELELYDPDLLRRPYLVLANKIDQPAAQEKLKQFQERFPDVSVLPISALTGEGLEELKEAMRRLVEGRMEENR